MINKKIYNTLPVFKKSNKKYQLGGMSAEEAKKIRDRAKEIRGTEAERMKDESIKTMIVASNNSPITPSTSSTTPVTTAPISNKTVVRLDDGSTNDYYEVDVDAAGKPMFNTKTKLTATQKKSYSDSGKYYFDESPAATTSVPTLAVTATPKIASTSTASENKPSIRNNTSSEKKPQVVKPTVTTKKTIPYNTEVENFQFMYNYANRDKVGFIPLGEDGKIGPKTAEAMANVNMYPKELKDYVNKNSYLSNLIGVSTSNTTTSSADSSDIKRLTTTAKADSSKAATDTSRISAMLSDSLGVKPDTSATWQKPAPKKVVSIVPPSLNQSDNSYDKSETAAVTRQVGKKDINKGDKLLKPQPDTWDAWIDRGQADIGAASLGASLTGVGTPIAKAVDAVSTAVDAVQLAAAIRRGDVPEQWNQGIQVGARFLVPAAGRVAGSAIRKVMPEITEEAGYNIGRKFMEKVTPAKNVDKIAKLAEESKKVTPMSKYNTVGLEVIEDMRKVPGYMSRIDNDVVKDGLAAKEFMKKATKKTNPAEVAQAQSAIKRYEEALLASNKKDASELLSMQREMAGQKFNKEAAFKQTAYKKASVDKALEAAKIPKLKNDGYNTTWRWLDTDTEKLIAEQEALLAKARTMPEVRRINEQLKKLYTSKVIQIKPVKVPPIKKQFGGYRFI